MCFVYGLATLYHVMKNNSLIHACTCMCYRVMIGCNRKKIMIIMMDTLIIVLFMVCYAEMVHDGKFFVEKF